MFIPGAIRIALTKSTAFLILFVALLSFTYIMQGGKPMGVTIGSWNARGYLSATPYLREKLRVVDILAVSEHWLHANRLGILSSISDSHEVHAHASRASSAENYGSRRGQGGVAIFWRKDIPGISKVTDIIHDRICAIRLQTVDGQVFYFLSVYLPAQGANEGLEASLDELSEVIDSIEGGSHIIVCGDFNGDIGVLGGPRGVKDPGPRGRSVANFFKRHNLIATNLQEYTHGPVNTFTCHNGASCIDYIAIPEVLGDSVCECLVEEWHPLNNSDHSMVSITMDIGKINLTTYPTPNVARVRWDKLELHEMNVRYTDKLETMSIGIKDIFDLSDGSPADIDDCFSKLTDAMHRISDELPKSRYRKNLKPFWNPELSRLKYEKVRFYRLWVDSGRPRDPDNPDRKNYKDTKKNFSRQLKKIARQYENEEIVQIVKTAEVNRNSFWNRVRSFRRGPCSKSLAIKREDGKVVHQINDVLEVWRRHFSKRGTPKTSDSFDDLHFRTVSDFVELYNDGSDCSDTFLQDVFSTAEVKNAIKTLNKGKAPGFDRIVAEHIKYAGESTVDLLCTLYNRIRATEYIPTCFRLGVQIPLFKGKDLSNLAADSYRGITLLSTFNKLFEILLWNRLKVWWVSENVVSELQGACKAGHSCLHTAFLLQETIATTLENNNNCIVAFYDVAKAFDSVWIGGLIHDT